MTRTLLSADPYEEVIKRSRFIAHAAPVSSEADTLRFYEQVADPAATHNCWAWIVDFRSRFNDDGEPSGTAGRPILSVLEGRELDGVMVVVTRYYGGIKLGAGGLVRAYSGTAAKCLDRARTEERISMTRCRVESAFQHTGLVRLVLTQMDASIEQEEFREEGVCWRVSCRSDRLDLLRDALAEGSRGQVRFSPVDPA